MGDYESRSWLVLLPARRSGGTLWPSSSGLVYGRRRIFLGAGKVLFGYSINLFAMFGAMLVTAYFLWQFV
jgi:hypothetical protein